ncbi:sensor domain-containing protein [Rhodococcus kroppenstedtii]|uniref:sensor domain-containing protein n=1 Tax=Rhodococcoides kroppenstedtii TaxID=293050 RepID=UPI002952B6D9|nr:sensor domain-containing protein [Rhodococcus kroppenstedtii]MDV7197931.1 sensor domain-containing protein [Rhodococcus kroppenstedtii]
MAVTVARASAALVAGMVSVAVLAGCSTDAPDTDESTESTPPAPRVDLAPFEPVPVPTVASGATPIVDNAFLAGRLLTIADLPAGWTGYDLPPLDPSAPGATAEDRSSTDPADCAAVLAPIATAIPGGISAASVSYGGPNFASLDQDAASYDGDGAVTAFGRIQDALARCGTFSGTDADGVRVDYRVGASDLLSGPDAVAPGDAAVAARIQVTSDGVELTTDAVITLVGATVTQIVATGLDPVDADLVRGLATTAADRLRT